jgi:hypothetical protein
MGRSCRCLFVGVSVVLVTALSPRGQSATVNRSSAPGEVSAAGRLAANPARFFQPRLPVLPTVPGQPAPPGVIGFPQMVHAAGIIFAGQVLSIAREPALGGASIETIAITFHIDRALRGTTTGKTLTIHEWTGLWSSGQRYRAGERVLLFLYPASKLGLTSCVAGPVGRFAVDPRGRVLLSDQHVAAFGSDPVLAGKPRVNLDDFAEAVRGVGGEERVQP